MQLIREALRGRDRDGVAISVKFGLLRAPDGQMVGIDGRPAAVKAPSRTRYAASGPIMSTYTAWDVWTPRFQSRRRSVRSGK
jgi:hypothetical protein